MNPRPRRRLRAVLGALGAAAVAVAGVALGRAARVGSPAPPESRVLAAVDATSVAEHLAGAIRFRTVAGHGGAIDGATFGGLHDSLRRTYPLVHDRLEREKVGESSLLYLWRGSDGALAPVVLMAHLDVVPVLPGTESGWTHPPYSGAVEGGFVYGRGALDDKGAVVAILEAAETLLAQGHRPLRTIYLAFGGDEEVGGERVRGGWRGCFARAACRRRR